MAKHTNQSLVQLEDNLLDSAAEYDFFQAYHLLSRVNDSYPVSARKPRRKIEVRPELNISFSDNDITGISKLPKEQGFSLTTQLPGLYGVSSPLPDFYTEDLLDNEWDDNESARDFLDIIHNQIFPKLYSAWKLYRLNTNLVEGDRDSYFRLLSSLIGNIQNPEDDSVSSFELLKYKLKYFQIFSLSHRCSEGIKIMIQDILNLDELSIRECQTQIKTIPKSQRTHIGKMNTTLGQDTHLGSKILDRSMGIKFETEPLSNNQFQTIYQATEKLDTLRSLLSEYIRTPFQVTLVIHYDSSEVQTKLGMDWNRLGFSAKINGINQRNSTGVERHIMEIDLLNY